MLLWVARRRGMDEASGQGRGQFIPHNSSHHCEQAETKDPGHIMIYYHRLPLGSAQRVFWAILRSLLGRSVEELDYSEVRRSSQLIELRGCREREASGRKKKWCRYWELLGEECSEWSAGRLRDAVRRAAEEGGGVDASAALAALFLPLRLRADLAASSAPNSPASTTTDTALRTALLVRQSFFLLVISCE